MSKDEKSNYYDHGGIEVLDVIQAKLTTAEYLGFLKGTAIRYLLRAPFKHPNQNRELEKAANYTRWAAEHAAGFVTREEAITFGAEADELFQPPEDELFQSSTLNNPAEPIDAADRFKESWALMASIEGALGADSGSYVTNFTIDSVISKVVYFSVVMESTDGERVYTFRATATQGGACRMDSSSGDQWLQITAANIRAMMRHVDQFLSKQVTV